jgi:hypothetical protein
MPTSTKSRYDKSRSSTKKALADYYVYAPLGAGDLVIEKSRELSRKAWTRALRERKQLLKAYRNLARRGEKLVTSIRKTGDATATATKAAVKKVG